jgi:hypothetical protein
MNFAVEGIEYYKIRQTPPKHSKGYVTKIPKIIVNWRRASN